MNDPAFIAEADRQHPEIAEVGGDKSTRLLQSSHLPPPDVMKAANEAMAPTGAARTMALEVTCLPWGPDQARSLMGRRRLRADV